MMIKPSIVFFLVSLIFGCSDEKNDAHNYLKNDSSQLPTSITCSLEDSLVAIGLIDIQTTHPGIRVNLRYSTLNNFLHQDIYGCLNKAYFQKETADKLAQAQNYLSELDTSYHLLIWDGVRPLSAQKQMWNSLQMPFNEKVKYVSNPKNGSIHNYGCAVDLTICKSDGKLLDMGTDFDHFGKAANVSSEYLLLTDTILHYKQFDNRKLLRKVMTKAGFTTLSSEWWHFNSMSRSEAKKRYSIIE